MSDVPRSAARADYFAGGEAEVRDTLRVLRQIAGPAFQQDRILDFGCGDGRLTIPLGRVAQHVVGVGLDATTMVDAAENCRQAGVSNVELVLSRPGLANVAGPFDVVHSRDVFHRLDPALGYAYVNNVLDLVTGRGGGMLHFTLAGERSGPRASHIARRSQEMMLRLLHLDSEATGPAFFDYDLGRLFEILHAKRFDRMASRFTEQGGRVGLKLFFWRGY